MGRRRKLISKIKTGEIYFADRRIEYFSLFKKIKSRQLSLNKTPDNIIKYYVASKPINTSILISSHDKIFGKEYVKILVAGSNQDIMIGYLSIGVLEYIITGKLKWIRFL